MIYRCHTPTILSVTTVTYNFFYDWAFLPTHGLLKLFGLNLD